MRSRAQRFTGRVRAKEILDASTGALEPLEPRALAGGHQGIRVSGNTAWLEQKHWRDFMEYETELNRGIGDQPMLVLCTYPLTTSGASEFLDVAGTHQFAVAKRRGCGG